MNVTKELRKGRARWVDAPVHADGSRKTVDVTIHRVGKKSSRIEIRRIDGSSMWFEVPKGELEQGTAA